MMHEYGVDVTVVEMLDSLLPGMEAELGQALEQRFVKRGIKIHTAVKVESISQTAQGISARISGMPDLDIDRVLVATGRRANTESLGLDSVGISTDRGFIRVNERMQSSVPGYYCIGDANGQCLLAHAASAQAVTAIKDALSQGEDFDLPIPSAVYTFPEVAAVGLTSEQANEQGIPISVGQFPIGHLGKAMAVGEEFGFARIVRHRTDNTLLGVHLIGHNATEIIEAATAMLGLKANAHDLADMIFAHPTIGEAVKEAAEDSFQQALHLPPRKHMRMMADVV